MIYFINLVLSYSEAMLHEEDCRTERTLCRLLDARRTRRHPFPHPTDQRAAVKAVTVFSISCRSAK